LIVEVECAWSALWAAGVTSLGAPVVRSCRGFEKLYGFKRICVNRAGNAIRLENFCSLSSSFARFELITNDPILGCFVVSFGFKAWQNWGAMTISELIAVQQSLR
jgi:hypothetical protein